MLSCLASSSCHLMHGVMDCIEIQGFGTFKICFASGCSVLCLYTHLQIFLGAVGYDFAEKLCEFCCVLCFFVSCFFIVQTYPDIPRGMLMDIARYIPTSEHSPSIGSGLFDIFGTSDATPTLCCRQVRSSPCSINFSFGALQIGQNFGASAPS